MRTITLHTVAGRAAAAVGSCLSIAALALSPATPARAGEAAAAPGDQIFEARLEAGYRAVDTEDNRSLLFPYDPLTDGPILGFDLLYLTPGFGTLRLEAGRVDADLWRAEAGYNHGADFEVRAGSRAFTHARDHIGPVPAVNVPIATIDPSTGVPFLPMELEGADADPDRTYRDTLRESTASAKVRAPGYPAHVRASGRIRTRQGEQQLRYFFRSCSTHLCHMNSRTRELDQVTREYTLGLDTHAGPVDIAYSHSAQTFRDEAPDPVDAVGNINGGLGAGSYPHDVNPDLRSFNDALNLNTNLTNRTVLSLAYSGGEQENETSDLSRRTRSAGATLSWRPAPSAFVVGRYRYDEERTGDLGAEALALRERRNTAHATLTHRHAIDPDRIRHTGEISARFSPIAGADLTARLRHRTLKRNAVFHKDGTTFVEEADLTRSTLAGLDGRLRVSPALVLDGQLGREWTEVPVYAIETTGITRYGLGATWTPAPIFLLRASWQGFRGENDDEDALQHAYARTPDDPGTPRRTVAGDAFSASASFAPAPEFSLTASWSLTDNGVEQDLLFGSPANPGFSFLSPDTAWDGRVQLADLRARWAVTRRLALIAEGLWIDSLESYEPTFPAAEGLQELSTVEFTKLLGSLQAELRVTDTVGVTLAAFWTRYDDQADDAGDGTARGVLAAVDVRW